MLEAAGLLVQYSLNSQPLGPSHTHIDTHPIPSYILPRPAHNTYTYLPVWGVQEAQAGGADAAVDDHFPLRALEGVDRGDFHGRGALGGEALLLVCVCVYVCLSAESVRGGTRSMALHVRLPRYLCMCTSASRVAGRQRHA